MTPAIPMLHLSQSLHTATPDEGTFCLICRQHVKAGEAYIRLQIGREGSRRAGDLCSVAICGRCVARPVSKKKKEVTTV